MENTEFTSNASPVNTLSSRYQATLDRLVPYTVTRWIMTTILLILFMLRIIFVQGWYIIAYALGIYLLNMFLAFLSPKFDPEFNELMDQETGNEDDSNGPGLLPTKKDDEFRPFIRRLPEFKFWQSATYAILISMFCSFFTTFDIPVFWPILLFYWFLLFFLTMRRQISHMIKYKYVPFSNWGKKRYSSK
ncbi:Protein RER1 [Smittium mucronatum]|uniref:Protein RER1 n=1 Tax=Smittium mucronatum TaxID=133383 RepID=A0A1R0H8X4_9FUNG|nr:Protein RER1 [Smittium mucronatum]